MTDSEICVLYRDAKSKKRQIRILSELTLKTPTQIKKILERAGFDLSNAKNAGRGRPDTAWYDEEAQRLYDEGADVDEMTKELGIPRNFVRDWHFRNGYKFHLKKKCSNCVHGKEDGSGHIVCVWNGKVKRMHICGRFDEV